MIIGFDASRAFVPERTGTENYSFNLLRAMVENGKGHEFVIYMRKGASPAGVPTSSSVRIQTITWPRLWTQGGLAMRTWLDKLDVLFVPAHTLPVLRKPGLPTVVTIHGLEYEFLPGYYRFPQRLYLTWSTRYAARFATRVIAVSQFTADELTRRFGVEGRKIHVVHEGVDHEFFGKKASDKERQYILQSLGIRKPYILFVGVVQPRKNLQRAIEAFSLVLKRLAESSGSAEGDLANRLTFIVAGKLGWMYKGILEAPRKYGVGDRVKFVSFVPDEALPTVLEEAELLLMPSLVEGFGLPVLEAMAVRTPVVAANAGALPEVVGPAGVLVDPTSSGDIARGLMRVLCEPGLRRQLIEKGGSWCRRFSWRRAAIETLSALGEAAQKVKS